MLLDNVDVWFAVKSYRFSPITFELAEHSDDVLLVGKCPGVVLTEVGFKRLGYP